MEEKDMIEEEISYNIKESLKAFIEDWKLNLIGGALYDQLCRDFYFYNLALRQKMDGMAERKKLLKTISQIKHITSGTPEEAQARKDKKEKIRMVQKDEKLKRLYDAHKIKGI